MCQPSLANLGARREGGPQVGASSCDCQSTMGGSLHAKSSSPEFAPPWFGALTWVSQQGSPQSRSLGSRVQ